MSTQSDIAKIIWPIAAMLLVGCSHIERPAFIEHIKEVRQEKLNKVNSAQKELLVALRQHRIIKAHQDTYIVPVEGAVSSQFGRRWGRSHEGIDIAARIGTPIRAARAGKVIYSGSGIKGYGNLIVLNHGGGFRTVYAHNDKNLVRKGQYVRQGEKIALLGNTGRSSGPHLHFEIRQGSKPYDPLYFVGKRGSRGILARKK